ncbi:type II toxin-antitoxin system RelE/ParE family toxin [Belliella sp. DSM 107340]|uniref:Type II toxin-antitoxin system RelE/ParE family toxin n=1 Tax=Belliella calami TaxID=2923436 RepID=A0ABS9UNZ4_9BACT|nr:type II toxin-antitoxin system RelE/ParE family toxin [Belliella calami]MCH7398347.1 type II toxin-antitoxin system RelE/ParE family toxin [Belliella calami]
MIIRFLSPAKVELDESYAYYESQQFGLGEVFLKEVMLTINRIKENPSAWSNISKRTRRCLLNKFPYGVIYQIRDEEILVLAIAHLQRKPGYWNKNV